MNNKLKSGKENKQRKKWGNTKKSNPMREAISSVDWVAITTLMSQSGYQIGKLSLGD